MKRYINYALPLLVIFIAMFGCKNKEVTQGATAEEVNVSIKIGDTREDIQGVEGYERVGLRFQRHDKSYESVVIDGATYQIVFKISTYSKEELTDEVVEWSKVGDNTRP